MNFVAEILCSAEKVDIENLNKKVPDILSTIDEYKQNVFQYIDEVHTKLSRKPKSNTILLNKTKALMDNISNINGTINEIIANEISKTSSNISAYKQELSKSKHAERLVSKVIEIHEILLSMNNCTKYNKYVDGIKLIKEIEQYRADSEIIQFEAFNELIRNFEALRVNLVTQLVKEYRECVQYNITNPFTLTIEGSENFVEILNAVGLSSLELMDELITFLWDNMFYMIVNCKTSINIVEIDRITKLSLDVIDEKLKDNYTNIFKNLILVSNFLNNYFNYPLNSDTTTLDYIGRQVGPKLSEHLIDNCLANTIPTNNEELQKYTVVVNSVEALQTELVKCKIFSDETDSVIKYVKNVDTLFLNKKCAEYEHRAREIMKKDLHDMVEIGTPPDQTNLLQSSNIFPYCFISKSTLELIDLADKIMQSATAFEANAEQLYSTVQNIFHIYGSVVERHHQKFLQTIPQQVALFHNNCMYLSFILSNWAETYQKLTTIQIDPTLFVQESNFLKQIGNRAFVDSLQQQINQVEDIMKESGLTSLNTLETLEPRTEKSIRQCLRQQELLRTVWHKVLPYSDYNRSIGCILNYLCNCITNAVLKFEDISSEAGDQLVDIFKVILTRGPKLFTDPKDIPIYVKNWYRFNELVFILSSSLIEICDRWTDGKGPLALQFKPEEVQKLIRALFQNTDRRAAVLARIVK